MTVRYRNALPEGTRIGEYRLARVPGAGGFGITYLAADVDLRTRVAIKECLPADLAVREETRLALQPSERRRGEDDEAGGVMRSFGTVPDSRR